MTACPASDELAGLLDDAPPDAARESLERHLDDCADCRQRLLDLCTDSRMETLLRIKPDPAPPQELLDKAKTAPFLHPPPRQPADALPTVPGYEILCELGRGGMAVVYKARQVGLNRLVALKMILAANLARPELRERFRTEAATVANLKHPHIVQVHDIGEHEGRPYFSLEFVEGGTLTGRARGTPQPPAEAAALVATLAWAMDYAHQKGLIHRDLKPANVLIGRDGDAIVPKIADFGIARFTHEDSQRTMTGELLGTPAYMAPEQAQGRRNDVGFATDIHGLGVILFELLTGRLPFSAPTAVDTLLQISFEESPSPRRLLPGIPRDLDTICLKCLRKLPGQRYRTARELAEDLDRFRGGEPILARPISAPERLVKWARRRPVIAALTLGIILVTVAGFAGVGYALYETDAARRNEAAARQRAVEALDRSERSVYLGAIAQARSQWLLGSTADAEGLLAGCAPERRDWEWHFLRGLNHTDLLTITDPGGPYVTALAYSPTGHRLAAGGGNPFDRAEFGTVEVFDSAGKRLWQKRVDALVRCVAYSPDGRYIAAGTGYWIRPVPGELVLWDAETGERLRAFPDQGGVVHGAAFSPDGRWLAAANADGFVRVWNVETGAELFHEKQDHPATSVAFSPSGKHLAVGGQLGRILDARTGKLIGRIPSSGRILFGPDSKHLAAVDGLLVRVWSYAELDADPKLTPVQTIAPRDGSFPDAAFSADGRSIATAGSDGLVRIWDLGSSRERTVYRGHNGRASAAAFHPEGLVLATAGQQPAEIKLWDLTRPGEHESDVSFAAELRDIDALGFSADDRRVLVLGKGGVLRRCEVGSGSLLPDQSLPLSNAWMVPAELAALSGDGRRAAGISRDDPNTVKSFEADTGREIASMNHEFRVRRVVCDRNGRVVASAAFGARGEKPVAELRVWNAESGQLLHSETTPAAVILGLAVSPDGGRLAEARARLDPQHFELRILPADGSGTPVPLKAPNEPIRALAFSADGMRLAAAVDRDLYLWDERGDVQVFHGPDGISALAFNPSGTRIAGVSRDRVQVWDAASGQRILLLRGAESRPNDNAFNPCIAWSHDGRMLAASNWNRVVSIWNSADAASADGKMRFARLADTRAMATHLNAVEQSLQWPFSFQFHRERLMNFAPRNGVERRLRADFLARCGFWNEACAEYRILSESPADWLALTLLQLQTGDLQQLGEERSRLIRTPPADPWRRADMLRACLVVPSADSSKLLDLTRTLARQLKDDPEVEELLGLALLRAGDAERARGVLARLGNRPKAEAVAALIHIARRDLKSAAVYTARTSAWLATQERNLPPVTLAAPLGWNWKEYLEVKLLHREALLALKKQWGGPDPDTAAATGSNAFGIGASGRTVPE